MYIHHNNSMPIAVIDVLHANILVIFLVMELIIYPKLIIRKIMPLTYLKLKKSLNMGTQIGLRRAPDGGPACPAKSNAVLNSSS